MISHITMSIVKQLQATVDMIRIIRALILITCLLGINACSTLAPATSTQSDKQKILVVNTNTAIDRYEIVQQAFTSVLSHATIVTIDLKDDLYPSETLQDELNKHQFNAVYTIGAKALGTIDYLAPNVPVVFSSVLNWRRFENQTGIYGVASEVSLQAQLTWLKHFFPETARVGVIYSDDNDAFIKEASHVAEELNIMLISRKSKHSDDVNKRAEELLPKVDFLWLISDPRVLSSTRSAKALFSLAEQQKVPVFAYSDIFMDFGAVISVSSDMATTGRQAGLLTSSLLNNHKPKHTVSFPAGSNISLNLDKVKAYNLKLNNDALDSVSHLIRH